MATTTARTQQDVDNMSKKDRLWDSLNYSYGLKREDSERQYDKAYSQADRQAMSRGMQRSSYNAQNLANINQQKINASNDIWNTQIADYENRLSDLEQQEAEADRWERQFAANREDAAWNQAFQEKQYQAGRDDTAWNQAFQEKQYQTQIDQWEKQFGYNQKTSEQQIYMTYAMNALQNGQMPSADLLAKAGLTAADAQAMMKQASSGGGGGGGSHPDVTDEYGNVYGWDKASGQYVLKQKSLYGNERNGTGGLTDQDFIAGMNGPANTQPTGNNTAYSAANFVNTVSNMGNKLAGNYGGLITAVGAGIGAATKKKVSGN